MNFFNKYFDNDKNDLTITNQQIVSKEKKINGNERKSCLIIEALDILEKYKGNDKNMLLFRGLNIFIKNGLFIIAENQILKLENLNLNKYDKDGGYVLIASTFAYEKNLEKVNFYLNKVTESDYKEYQKNEINNILTNKRNIHTKNRFPIPQFNFIGDDYNIISNCDSNEKLQIFLELKIVEEENKTKSKEWRANNIGEKFEGFVNFCLNTNDFMKAELIINFMPPKIHKWNSLKNLAINQSKINLHKSLEIVKTIKDSRVNRNTIGLIGLYVYDKQGFDVSFKLISDSKSDNIDSLYCRLIEKLIINNELNYAKSIVEIISHDLYRYNALTFLIVYYLINNEKYLVKELLNFLSIPEFKIKLLGCLIYFESRICDKESVLETSWFYFAPERYQNYELEFWELFKRE